MKTIDEVIKALEWCIDDSHDDCDGCPYDTGEVTDCHDRNVDALHYLREYKEYTDTMCALPDYCEYIHSADNPPLDWDELKQMFHKPVWIETKTKKVWVIINNFEAVTPNSENVNVIHTSHRGAKCSHFARHLMGQTWQAYRKERG